MSRGHSSRWNPSGNEEAPFPQPKTWILRGCGSKNTEPVNNFCNRVVRWTKLGKIARFVANGSLPALPSVEASAADKVECPVLVHAVPPESRQALRFGNGGKSGRECELRASKNLWLRTSPDYRLYHNLFLAKA